MIMGQGAETARVVSLPCGLGGRQHDVCHGWVIPGNRRDMPKLPCGCRQCADNPRHRAAREAM